MQHLMWQNNGNTNKLYHSLRPAIEAMVQLMNIARSVPCLCCQRPCLTAVLHPHVVGTFPRTFSPLTTRETQWIYRNLLVSTFLLFEQEHCAADSNLETRGGENTCSSTPLAFLAQSLVSYLSELQGVVYECVQETTHNSCRISQVRMNKIPQKTQRHRMVAPVPATICICWVSSLHTWSTMQLHCYDVHWWPCFNIIHCDTALTQCPVSEVWVLSFAVKTECEAQMNGLWIFYSLV